MGMVRGAESGATPAGPAPGGESLQLLIECRTSRSATHAEQHPIVIGPDWSVETPHDLDAERVGVAFGGYSSCLELVDAAVPALRAALERLSRRKPLPIRRDKRGSWRILPGHQFPGCCKRVAFPSIDLVARHLHGARHLAQQFGAPQWQLTSLLAAAERAWAGDESAPDQRVARGLVRETGGVAELWRAGIHPDQLPGIAAIVPSVTEPLPVSFYLGVVYGRPDRAWLREVVAHRPDGDTAAWLAWHDLPTAGRDTALWAGWLDLGVHLSGVCAAVELGLNPARAGQVARATGRPVGIVARDIVRWALAGCEPTAEHFAELARHGLEHAYPSAVPLDVLVAEAGRRGLAGSATRTDLAVMLLVHGAQSAVLAALEARTETLPGVDGDRKPAGTR